MRELPMLFNGPMVRAVLNDTKTNTRRVLKPQPQPCQHQAWPGESKPNWVFDGDGWHCASCGNGVRLDRRSKSGVAGLRCPYGQPGDRLWVRESFAHIYRGNAEPASRQPGDVVYMADGLTPDAFTHGAWKPSIHMPRWASRLTLEITAVRIERLRDISAADAIAEGIELKLQADRSLAAHREVCLFAALWESTYGTGSWEANPLVWVIEFERRNP